MGGVRIATWNVERPKPAGWKIPPAQRQRMAEVNADIWVLTETHLDHAPSAEHRHAVFSPPHPERRPPHERWTAIWSRWPLTELDDPAAHPRGTVAARCDTPFGSVVIYGTVVAWANERAFDDATPAQMWQVHLAELERQGAEWRSLTGGLNGTPLVVAGDFNQDRDGSRWYGTAATRRLLDDQLRRADLTCLTTLDVAQAGLVSSGHLVDHMCVSEGLVDGALVHCWDRFDPSGQRLSDHPTVAVDLQIGGDREVQASSS